MDSVDLNLVCFIGAYITAFARTRGHSINGKKQDEKIKTITIQNYT